MVNARHFPNVINMIGHVPQRRLARIAMRLAPLRKGGGDARVVAGVQLRQTRLLLFGLLFVLAVRFRQISRKENSHHHAAVGRHLLEKVVGHVARVAAQGARARMRTNYRGLADLERRPHRVVGNVGKIHHHPQSVHFAHDRLAKGRQAAVQRLVGACVGPVIILDVGQRQVARSQGVAQAQRRQRVANRVAALDGDQRRDFSPGVNADNVVRRQRQFQRAGITGDEAADEVYLFQQHKHGLGAAQGVGNISDPELPPHAAGFQAFQIGRQRGS